MGILEFFHNHEFLAFLAICLTYLIVRYTLSLIRQIIRTPVLLKHGYPSAPYDADGDIHYPEKETK